MKRPPPHHFFCFPVKMWLPITTIRDCSVAMATITKQPLMNGCQQQIEGKQERRRKILLGRGLVLVDGHR